MRRKLFDSVTTLRLGQRKVAKEKLNVGKKRKENNNKNAGC